MALGDVLDYGFLYKQGATWNACKAATPTVSTVANGRVGAFYDGSTYTIGRMYVCIDTNYTDEFFNTTATFYPKLFFNVWQQSPKVSNSFYLLTQYWSPSLSASDWLTQYSNGYRDIGYNTTYVYGRTLYNTLGRETFFGGTIWSNTTASRGVVTNRHNGIIFSDTKTYYTMWQKYEAYYQPTVASYRGVYINAIPDFETDISANKQHQTRQWFIASSFTGSAKIGPHTTNLLKTNNKYGTR